MAVAETIREVGSVPAGVLYANVVDYLSLEDFQRVVAILKGAGLVEEDSHVLTWVGPASVVKLAAQVRA